MDVRVDTYAWLPKADLSPSQIAALKSQLTLVPSVRSFGDEGPPKPLRLYAETDTEIGIAREFFYKHKRDVHKVIHNWTEGDRSRFAPLGPFVAELRPEQQQALDATIAYLSDTETALGGILRAVPGWGKTLWGLSVAAHYNVPTLVLVHREFLVNQWIKRIKEFLPEAKIGIAQQDECSYEGASIVIGMVHSVVRQRYTQEFYDWPGLIIVDECHRMGAYTWSPAPGLFRARYRIGITATPRRKDGVENAFFYHIGQLLFSAKEQRLTPKVRRVWTNFKLFKTPRFNPNLAPRSLLIRFLLSSQVRNRTIVLQLVEAVKAGRKCMVVSEQLKHLKKLESMFLEEWPLDQGFSPGIDHYVGGRSEAELFLASQAQIVFTTSQFSSEGLDIPELDTLFLTAPLSDVEQVVGRILRPCHGKKDPIVVDFRDDNVAQFRKQGEKRDAYYDLVMS